MQQSKYFCLRPQTKLFLAYVVVQFMFLLLSFLSLLRGGVTSFA